MAPAITRRSVLQAAGALITCSLAGCSILDSDPDDGGPPSSRTTSSPSPSPTDETPTPTPTSVPACNKLTRKAPSMENGVWVAFAFSDAVARDDGPPVTIRCSRMVLRDGTGHVKHTYDIGGSGDQPEFVHGVYEPRQDDKRTYRWFGTEAIVQFPRYEGTWGGYSQVDVFAESAESDTTIEATTYAKNSSHYTFDHDGWYEYPITLHGEKNCTP